MKPIELNEATVCGPRMAIEIRWNAASPRLDGVGQRNTVYPWTRIGPRMDAGIEGGERFGRGHLPTREKGKRFYIGGIGNVWDVANHDGSVESFQLIKAALEHLHPACVWPGSVSIPEQEIDRDDERRFGSKCCVHFDAANFARVAKERNICVPSDGWVGAAEHDGQYLSEVYVSMMDGNGF